METIDFAERDLHALHELAARAARLAVQLQSSLSESIKADGTIVTQADLQAEELLRDGLARLWPGLAVIGEEQGGAEETGEAVFYVDPIDGTLSYARGMPTWAVCVGLLVADRPHAGVVVAPALGKSWWGMAGLAAFCGHRPIRRQPTALGENALISITTGALRRFGPPPKTLGHIRCHGSIALETCLCADNQVDAAVLSRWKPWDIIGAAAIFLAAGGVILTSDGSLVPSWRGDFYDELVLGGSNLADLVPQVIPGWAEPAKSR